MIKHFSIEFVPGDIQPWRLNVQYDLGHYTYFKFSASEVLMELDCFCDVPMPGWPG